LVPPADSIHQLPATEKKTPEKEETLLLKSVVNGLPMLA
jgi:hypothetical protein